MLTAWKESDDQPRQHIKKQRHYFANEGPSSQGYGFSSGHVWMWKLDCVESWELKNWCFWTMVLEKTLQSPLDFKEILPVHLEGDQSWVFLRGRDWCWSRNSNTLTPIAKSWLIRKDPGAGKDWKQEEKGIIEDEMVGWHHWLDGQEFEQVPGVGDAEGSLVHCCLWGRKESRYDWATELTDIKRYNFSRGQFNKSTSRKLLCQVNNFGFMLIPSYQNVHHNTV